MPTLLRFLFAVSVLTSGGLAAMVALATYAEPEARQITIPVLDANPSSAS
ncbi:histidine kinase [Microvirga thermotolerans]|uniref:Histidine kinase n=1 Tax=Microvirga thermotolerans TaxID=2651334 RepID=A0A5P9K3P9_9HYPH|nr:histidine kinase [Microvirga thermotolerans]